MQISWKMYSERFCVSLSQGKFCRHLFWILCSPVFLLMTWMVEDCILNYTQLIPAGGMKYFEEQNSNSKYSWPRKVLGAIGCSKDYLKELCFKMKCNDSSIECLYGINFTEKKSMYSSGHILELNHWYYAGEEKKKKKKGPYGMH